MLFNVPNIITAGRILIIPVVGGLLYKAQGASLSKDQLYSFWAMLFFTLAAISDLVDGYYARKYGQVSLMGKFFDPMADKLIHMTAMVLLIPLDRMPAWLVSVLLFREIFINGLRTMAIGEGIVIDAASWGKKKTAWLNVGLAALILHYPVFAETSFQINTQFVGWFCVVIGTIFSVASGLQYTIQFFKKVKDKKVK